MDLRLSVILHNMPRMHAVSQVPRVSGLDGIVHFWWFYSVLSLYMTTPALEAIRGQSSAASFPTGPVMAEPFISPLLLTICRKKLLEWFHWYGWIGPAYKLKRG